LTSRLLSVLKIAQAYSETTGQQDVYVFDIGSEGDSQKFLLKPPRADKNHTSDNMAVLNQQHNIILAQLASQCTFKAYSPVSNWNSIGQEPSLMTEETCVLVDLVIYGREEDCDSVGDILNTRKIYLQEPDWRDPDVGYRNPHFIDLKTLHLGEEMDLDPLRASALQLEPGIAGHLSDEQAMTQKALKDKIAAAFKNMTRSQNLSRIAADSRVRTSLLP